MSAEGTRPQQQLSPVCGGKRRAALGSRGSHTLSHGHPLTFLNNVASLPPVRSWLGPSSQSPRDPLPSQKLHPQVPGAKRTKSLGLGGFLGT